MTNLTFNSTSAGGAMLASRVADPVLIGCMFAGLGTSTAYVMSPNTGGPLQRPTQQTSAGTTAVLTEPAGSAIGQLRRLSGFTWDQLARLFNVSRRSLHLWASGGAMAPRNEEHLQRLLMVVQKIDRGSASANRAALLGIQDDGSLPFDLLADAKYERVLSLLGQGTSRKMAPIVRPPELRAARAPRPPEELVGALQDRVHPKSGRLLAAKVINATRRK